TLYPAELRAQGKGDSLAAAPCPAERAGFEPAMERSAPYSLSRRVPSATRPPLRGATSLETRASGRMLRSGGVAERLNATVLKTVWPVAPVTRVRIPPPPLSSARRSSRARRRPGRRA